MPSQRSKRRSRKQRNPATPPRAVPSTRREARADRAVGAERERRRGQRQLGREGERPQSPFGGLPISELAILVGFIALVLGYFESSGAALVTGVIVCALGVIEVTAREHFSGFRSHTVLLAAIPAVALETAVGSIFGASRQQPLLLLLISGPVFVLLFWLLRRRFLVARQARIARPPAP